MERLLRDLAHILSIYPDGSRIHIVEARQQGADGRFAAARRADERKRLAGVHDKVEATYDLGIRSGVGEVHVLVDDLSFCDGKRLRIRRILDIGLRVEHFLEAGKAGNRFEERLREVQDVRDRRREERDIERIGRKVDRLHASLGAEPAATDDDADVEYSHHHGNERLVDAHRMVHAHLRGEVGIVRAAELLPFQVLSSKALDDTGTGQGILDAGVHTRDALAVLDEDCLHAAVREEVEDDKDRQDDREHRGELSVDASQDHEGADNLDESYEQELRAVVRRLGDIEEIAHEAAHEVARLVAVEVGEAHPLIGIEEVLAHLRLHTGTHHVSPEDHEVAAGKAHGIHRNEAKSYCPEG